MLAYAQTTRMAIVTIADRAYAGEAQRFSGLHLDDKGLIAAVGASLHRRDGRRLTATSGE